MLAAHLEGSGKCSRTNATWPVRVTLPELMQAVLGASISPYHSLRPALVPERERDRDSLGDLICDLAESFDRRLTFQPSLLAKDFAAQSP